MFSSSNFLYPYNITDKVIRIVNVNGSIVHSINICNYQKSSVSGKFLKISLEDNIKEYSLEFIDNTNAKNALLSIKQAVNVLKANCVQIPQLAGGESQTIIPITYSQYKSLRASNSLFSLQWYDVTDTGLKLFNDAVYTIRLLAKTINDSHPRGQIINTNNYITIDVLNDKVVSFEDPVNNIFVINSTFINNTFTDSQKITVLNNSFATTDNCYNLIVENNSILHATDCDNVQASNDCRLLIENCSNVKFNNIQQNLLGLGFQLVNLEIDRNNSIGKSGQRNLNNPSVSIDLVSYKDEINQNINFSTSDNGVSVHLSNSILQVQGVFKLKYSGVGNGNEIDVYDHSGNLLYTINDKDKDNIVTFSYNIVTELFELVGITSSKSTNSKNVQFVHPTNGQTLFDLNTPVSIATEMEMHVNGIKQMYNLDFSYNSTLGLVVFANRFYVIQSTDEVEFRVY